MIASSDSCTTVASTNEKLEFVSLFAIVLAAICEAASALTPAELRDSDATSRMFDTAVLAALKFNAAWTSAELAPGAVAAAIGSKLATSMFASKPNACLISS